MQFESLSPASSGAGVERSLLEVPRPASKNRYRLSLGVLVPQFSSEANGSAGRCFSEIECVLVGAYPHVEGRLRFLRIERRQVQALAHGVFLTVDRLDVEGRTWLSFEEGHPEEVPFEVRPATLEPDTPASIGVETSFSLPAFRAVEGIANRHGEVVGRVRRTRAALKGVVHARAEPVQCSSAPRTRLTLRVENLSLGGTGDRSRGEAMRSSLVSAQVLLAVEGGELTSPNDPKADSASPEEGSQPPEEEAVSFVSEDDFVELSGAREAPPWDGTSPG